MITTQDIVRVLIRVLVLVENMAMPLFLLWLLNPPFFHLFTKPYGIQQMLKLGS